MSPPMRGDASNNCACTHIPYVSQKALTNSRLSQNCTTSAVPPRTPLHHLMSMSYQKDTRDSHLAAQVEHGDQVASTRGGEGSTMDKTSEFLSGEEQSGAFVKLSAPTRACKEETKTGKGNIKELFSSYTGRRETGGIPLGTTAHLEGRLKGHLAEMAAGIENWRERNEQRSVMSEDLHRNRIQTKDDTKRVDRRRSARAPSLPHQRNEADKIVFSGIRCPEEVVQCDAVVTPLCYVKMLISNQLAGMVIGNTGQEVKRLKEVTGAKIVLSPHGKYFPGTSERLISAEGTERSVFQVIDWIIDRMHELAEAKTLGTEERRMQLKSSAKARSLAVDTGITDAFASGTMNTSIPLSATPPPPSTCMPLTCKLCVPRAVVGSLIGRKGGYIQSVRVATEANINISPLFVTADEACAERIITIESSRLQSLRTATFTLARKINSHPEKATCKHMRYYRKLNFEPSPLALLEENRRARMSCRFAAMDVPTKMPESQPCFISAGHEYPVGSPECSQRANAVGPHRSLGSSHVHEPGGRGKPTQDIVADKSADLLYPHRKLSDDSSNERDVSCFSSASTATSATKINLPFKPSPLCQSALLNLGGATCAAASRFSDVDIEARTSAAESPLDACSISSQPEREHLPVPPAAGFFPRHVQSDITMGTDGSSYAAPSAPLEMRRGLWRDQSSRNVELSSHQNGSESQPGEKASDINTENHRHVSGCFVARGTDTKLTTLSQCQAESHDPEEGNSTTWSITNAATEQPRAPQVQLIADSGEYPGNVGVSGQLFQATTEVTETSMAPPPGLCAEEHVMKDEVQYTADALSHESLTPICSTAAGSIATLTNILQSIHDDMPEQPFSNHGATVDDSGLAKAASQESIAMAPERSKNCSRERKAASLPEDRHETHQHGSVPGFNMRNVADESELAAVAARFAAVLQNNAVTTSAVVAMPQVARIETSTGGSDSPAVEMCPSGLTLQHGIQQASPDGNDTAAALLQSHLVDELSEVVRSGQPHADGERIQGEMRTAFGVLSGEEPIVKQPVTEGGQIPSSLLQSLSTNAGLCVQHSDAELPVSAEASSAVTSVTAGGHEGSHLMPVGDISDQAPPTEEPHQPLSSRRHSIDNEQPGREDDKQRSRDAFETEYKIKEHLVGSEEAQGAFPVAICDIRSVGLTLVSRLTGWIPSLLDCGFLAFMMLWTTAIMTGVLLSLLFAHLGSP